MSRELKFRVWNPAINSFLDLSDGEWGYYYITPHGKFVVHYYSLFGNPEETKELDYMIVQQFTGLKDKNDKEIYEGDKLRCSGGKFQKKYDEFTKEDMVAEGNVVFYKGCFWCVDFPLFDYNELEIIGSVYEPPKLLEKETDITDESLDDDEEENEDLSSCEQCGENAWDGYICHSCGLKII